MPNGVRHSLWERVAEKRKSRSSAEPLFWKKSLLWPGAAGIEAIKNRPFDRAASCYNRHLPPSGRPPPRSSRPASRSLVKTESGQLDGFSLPALREVEQRINGRPARSPFTASQLQVAPFRNWPKSNQKFARAVPSWAQKAKQTSRWPKPWPKPLNQLGRTQR